MNARSNSLVVRNPILGLPCAGALQALPADAKSALVDVLMEISATAGDNAQKSWKKHKAPMACYWKAVAVYSKHIARALKGGAR